LDPFFVQIRDQASYAPARRVLRELWSEFIDVDGNFLEQWQTTAFDARTYEFFLFAYLLRSGYDINRNYDRPDFMIERGGSTIAIEAVTTNPSPATRTPRNPFSDPFGTMDVSPNVIKEKQLNELPIRFGSPLFSKLTKKYWELPHCQNIPIVLAIEAFHDPTAIWFASASLAQYLYGLRTFPTWTEEGQLLVRNEQLDNHVLGSKIIPSDFFNQPDTERISAVLFSNTGTIAKFNRMGYQSGYDTDAIAAMIRVGTCYDDDDQAVEPASFEYEVSERDPQESWGEGLEVIHNPRALNPLPRQFFDNAADTYLQDRLVHTDVPLPFHPYASVTQTIGIAP